MFKIFFSAIILLYFVYYCDCSDDFLNCSEDGFICKRETDKVIFCSQICDGFRDCEDGSDEGMMNMARNPCKDMTCPDGGVSCHYGACIPADRRCNHIDDCADGSDEWSFYCNPKLNNTKRTACSSEKRSSNYILDEYFCDGKADCDDKSDENEYMCQHWSCDETKVRCAYGACIDKEKRCNGKTDCVDGSDESVGQCKGTKLPLDPPLGCAIEWDKNYIIKNENNNAYIIRGEMVEANKRIIINCANGFIFADRSVNKWRLCNGVSWDSPLPKCVKFCDADILFLSNSTTVSCTLDMTPVDCANILPNTEAEIHCANSYRKWDDIRKELYSMKCLDTGKWNKDKMNCMPVCGESQRSTNQEASEAPWHVGVKTYLHGKCGGTIISVKNVITALHCVTDEDLIVLNETNVFVIHGGKLNDNQAQIITKNVSKIYAGDDSALDVAVLELSEPFVLSMNARPICMFKTVTTRIWRRGFLHGWSRNDDHTGEIFRKTELLNFSSSNCEANYTIGEFCVRPKHQNQTLCQGYSGSGVIVEDKNKNYLVGILSYKAGRSQECTNQPIVAVGIAHIENWLGNIISATREPSFHRVPF